MEIQKFEAYTYKGPDLDKISRQEFIDEIWSDVFQDQKICGYEVSSVSYDPRSEEIFLLVDKINNPITTGLQKVIKLDVSDMGIEIGTIEWDDKKEEYKDFIPEISLDDDIHKDLSKNAKTLRRDIKKYNI